MEHVPGLGTTSVRREPWHLATSDRSNWSKRGRNGQSRGGIPTGSVDSEDRPRRTATAFKTSASSSIRSCASRNNGPLHPDLLSTRTTRTGNLFSVPSGSRRRQSALFLARRRESAAGEYQ